MKKLLATVLAATVLFTGVASAEPMVGKKLAAGSNGQPFCLEVEDLKEFLTAALMEDKASLGSSMKEGRCTMLKRGTPISVLEDLGDEDEELHGVKVRAIGPKGSLVGYSLSVGMVPRR